MWLLLIVALALAGKNSTPPLIGGVVVKPDRTPKDDAWRCPPDAASPSAIHPYEYRVGMHSLCVWASGKFDFPDDGHAYEVDAWYAVVISDATDRPISPVFGPSSTPARAAAFADEWRRNT